MIKSKVYDIFYNSLFGIIATLISTIMTFLVRMVLYKSLGEDLYGLNTLFSSIVTTLLIMELGISTAITIYLYEPVIKKDYEKIKSIMKFYQNTYRSFCIILFLIGVFIDIFIFPLISISSLAISHVRIFFIIFLLSVIFKYLWSYKRSLLFANQKNRISIGITAICETIFGILQIIILLKTSNYYLYLIILVLQNVLSNCICNVIINKMYPFILEKNIIPISKEFKINILNTIKPMFVQRISGIIQNSSTAVILSFISKNIALIGFFGNYQLIVSTAQILFSQIGGAITTSFGNFSITQNKIEYFKIYKKSRFILNWVSIIIVVCFFALIQEFIRIFFGIQSLLDIKVVILLTIYLYEYLNNIILLSIQNAMGVHNLDAKQMIHQAVLNIILSTFLGYFFSLEGILFGTLISVFIFSTIYKGIIIFEKVFEQKKIEYIINLFKEHIRLVIVITIVMSFINLIIFDINIINWIIKGIVVFLLSNIILFLISIKNKKTNIIKISNIIKKLIVKNMLRRQ